MRRVIFSEGITHAAFSITNDSRRRSVRHRDTPSLGLASLAPVAASLTVHLATPQLFFNWVPTIDRDNMPLHRMSIYPDHVLERLADESDQLSAAGYI